MGAISVLPTRGRCRIAEDLGSSAGLAHLSLAWGRGSRWIWLYFTGYSFGLGQLITLPQKEKGHCDWRRPLPRATCLSFFFFTFF